MHGFQLTGPHIRDAVHLQGPARRGVHILIRNGVLPCIPERVVSHEYDAGVHLYRIRCLGLVELEIDAETWDWSAKAGVERTV